MTIAAVIQSSTGLGFNTSVTISPTTGTIPIGAVVTAVLSFIGPGANAAITFTNNRGLVFSLVGRSTNAGNTATVALYVALVAGSFSTSSFTFSIASGSSGSIMMSLEGFTGVDNTTPIPGFSLGTGSGATSTAPSFSTGAAQYAILGYHNGTPSQPNSGGMPTGMTVPPLSGATLLGGTFGGVGAQFIFFFSTASLSGSIAAQPVTWPLSGTWTASAYTLAPTAATTHYTAALAESWPTYSGSVSAGFAGPSSALIGLIDPLGPGGLLFQVDERTAAVWHFDEPDGVQPSDAAGNVGDLAGVATLPPPVRAPGVVGYGRAWLSPHGLGAQDVVVDATTLTRTMALEAILFPNGDGVRTVLQRGLNDGTQPETILFSLVLTTSLGVGTLQMTWQLADGTDAFVGGVDFNLPPSPPYSKWLYVAAVRRWISKTAVRVDYYVNGGFVGTVGSSDGDIGNGSGGTVLIGVDDGGGTPESGMLSGDVIDEVRISNAERTAEEIRQVFRRLFVFPGYARSAIRSFLPPGTAYSSDPGSFIQRELGVEGDGLAHAWHLADTLLDDWWPDRATQTIERWETITRKHPKANDFFATRRARVLARLGTVAGFSREQILEAIAPVLDCLASDLQVIENSNRFADPFTGVALGPTWALDAGGGALAVSGGHAALSFLAGHDARWAPGHVTPVRARRGIDAYEGTEVIAQITAATLANVGDMAGVFFFHDASGDARMWGLRWNGSALEFAHVAITAGVLSLSSFVAAVPAFPFYLRLRQNAGLVELTFGTSGFDGPWTIVAFATDIPLASWSGIFLASHDASPATGGSATFEEFRLWMPESVTVFQWYVYRNPALGGAPDIQEAQSLLEVLAPAHTLGVVFGSLFLTDDPNSLTDNQVLGS